MITKLKLTYLLLLFCSTGYGQIKEYSYKRKLTGIKDQWHIVALPNEIFKRVSNDLSDMRVFGLTKSNDTLEAPYILKLASEKISEKEVSFNLINQSKVSNGYYFTFEVPVETSVNQINLDFKEQNFDWKLTLEGSQNQQQWFSIIEDYRILSIKNEQTDYQFTKVKFPYSKYRYFRLFINSTKSPELIKAKLSLNQINEGKFREYSINSVIDEEKQNKQTIINIDLSSNVPVSKLTISVKNKYDYYRPVNITYLLDSFKTEKGWKYNYATLTSGTLSSIEKNEFKFNSTILKKLKIIIENQDNEPLQVDSFSVKGYIHEIVARFNTPGTYYLTYGNSKAEKPNYDIARFSDKIPKNLTALKLDDEQLIGKGTIKQTGPLFENKIWLWIIMALTIMVLGWFSLKMIEQK